MGLIKIFLIMLFFLSCDKDPISGLERGWIHNLNSDDSNDDDNQDPIPNETCNIPYETTGTNYSFVSPSKSIYRFGDSYNVTLSGIYSVGQVDGVYLILNDETVHSFGSWLVFSNNSRTFSLPSKTSTIRASNCYVIGVVDGGYQYISEPFTIY